MPARRVINNIVYRCLLRHPPHGVSVLIASSTTWCTSARRVIHRNVTSCDVPRVAWLAVRAGDGQAGAQAQAGGLRAGRWHEVIARASVLIFFSS